MAIAELKRNAVKMLDGINDELFWSQLCAYLALYTQWKNSGTKDHAPDFGALFNTGKNNSNVRKKLIKDDTFLENTNRYFGRLILVNIPELSTRAFMP